MWYTQWMRPKEKFSLSIFFFQIWTPAKVHISERFYFSFFFLLFCRFHSILSLYFFLCYSLSLRIRITNISDAITNSMSQYTYIRCIFIWCLDEFSPNITFEFLIITLQLKWHRAVRWQTVHQNQTENFVSFLTYLISSQPLRSAQSWDEREYMKLISVEIVTLFMIKPSRFMTKKSVCFVIIGRIVHQIFSL